MSVIDVPAPRRIQEFLRLLGRFSALTAAVTSRGPFTLAQLNEIHTTIVVPFVAGYEAFVARI